MSQDMTPEERAAQAIHPMFDAARDAAFAAGSSDIATTTSALMRAWVARQIRATAKSRAAAHAAEVARLEKERDEWKAQAEKIERQRCVVIDALERAEARATAPAGWSAAKVRAAEALAHAIESRTQVRYGTRDPLGMLVAEVRIPEDLWMAYLRASSQRDDAALRALDAEPHAAQQGGREEAREALVEAMRRAIRHDPPHGCCAAGACSDAAYIVDALDRYLAAQKEA